jgi:hypothetical protein
MKRINLRHSALALMGVMFICSIVSYRYSRAQLSQVYVTNIEFDDLLVNESVENKNSTDKNKVRYTCSSVEEAGEKLREGFKNRKTTVEIAYTGTITDYSTMSSEIHDVALEHTGVGNEGDYLNWNHTKVTRKYTSSTRVFTYIITYLDDASMEKATTAAIKKVENKLAISDSDSTYDKIKTIYDYLAKSITYDYNDTSDLPYTAYDAIINGKAVCQGYATLFYRILLDYGIENRIVVSTTHAWNLVKVGDVYYECDLTWDSQQVEKGQSYKYFLKSKINDSTHKWRTSAMSDEVPKLKRASSDYKSGSDSSDSASDSLGKTTLKVSKKGSSAILNWSTVSGAESYNIYRKSGSGSWKKISTVSKTTYTDKNLKAGTYSYRIQATSGSKTGKDSKAKTIKIK